MNSATWRRYAAHGPDKRTSVCAECGQRWPCADFETAVFDLRDDVIEQRKTDTEVDEAGCFGSPAPDANALESARPSTPGCLLRIEINTRKEEELDAENSTSQPGGGTAAAVDG